MMVMTCQAVCYDGSSNAKCIGTAITTVSYTVDRYSNSRDNSINDSHCTSTNDSSKSTTTRTAPRWTGNNQHLASPLLQFLY